MTSLDRIPHWALKLIGTLILFLLSMIFGSLPLKLQRNINTKTELYSGSTRKLLISLSNCFAGGVFFSTVILDLFPDVRGKMNEALSLVEIKTDFPLGDFIIGFGFIFMLILEQLVETCCNSSSFINHGHSHGDGGKNRRSRGSNNVFENDPDETHHLLKDDLPDDSGPSVLQSAGPINVKNVKKSVAIGPSTILSGNSITYSDESEDELQQSHSSFDTYRSHNGTTHRVRKLKRTKSLASMQSVRTSNFRLYMMVFAISLHSLFEGLSVGLLVKTQVLIQILIALLIHKSIIAFSIGVQLVDADLNTKVVLICLAIFAAMAPLGVGIGLLLLNSLDSVVKTFMSGILQGIATGTFLYVTFFEVLPHELNIEDNKLIKIMFVMLGYFVITGICYFENSFHKASSNVHPVNGTSSVTEFFRVL